LQQKISNLLNEEIHLFASGRTDAGVHAIGQMAHFETNSNFDIRKLPQAINSGLDKDVAVLSAKEVSSNFHARYNVKNKTYLYKIYFSKIEKPLKNGLAIRVQTSSDKNSLDPCKKMLEASKYFIGKHNFYGFCSSGTNVTDFVREIFDINVRKIYDEVHIFIKGNGFLYNMVRIIVGTLVDVAKGSIKPEDIPQIIASQDREKAGKTMPACGLYLFDVQY